MSTSGPYKSYMLRTQVRGLGATKNRFRRFLEALWLEYKITRQLSTGNGEQWVANWFMPRWFKMIELGFGRDEGPSIMWWLNHVENHNIAARNILEQQPGKKPMSAKEKKRARQALRRLMGKRRAAQVAEWLPLDPNGPNRREETRTRKLRDKIATLDGDKHPDNAAKNAAVKTKVRRRLGAHEAHRMLRALSRRAGITVEGGKIKAVGVAENQAAADFFLLAAERQKREGDTTEALGTAYQARKYSARAKKAAKAAAISVAVAE